jgi:hypothetical protein
MAESDPKSRCWRAGEACPMCVEWLPHTADECAAIKLERTSYAEVLQAEAEPKGLAKPIGRQILDQLAHAGVVAAIFALVLFVEAPVGGLLAGLAIGILAEWKEGGDLDTPGSLLDIACYSIAGAVLQAWMT